LGFALTRGFQYRESRTPDTQKSHSPLDQAGDHKWFFFLVTEHWSVGITGFEGLRDKVLDHRIREIMKSDLPKLKKGVPRSYCCGFRFPKREIEGPVESSSGRGRRTILCMWTSDLRVRRAVSIVTHLEFDILTMAPTLHHTTISDQYLKIRNREDKETDLLINLVMNKMMGATTINQHHN
jgi:hypothetical protein